MRTEALLTPETLQPKSTYKACAGHVVEVRFTKQTFSRWCSLALVALLPATQAEAETISKQGLAAHRGSAVAQLAFVENRGQLAPNIAAYTWTVSGLLAVTQRGDLQIALPFADDPTVLHQRLVGANGPKARLEENRAAVVNWVKGADPNRWFAGLQTYDRVWLGQVYPGIELELVAHSQNVEQLYRVLPRADPRAIRAQFKGARSLQLAPNGDLVVNTTRGALRLSRPHAYQYLPNCSVEVDISYVVDGEAYGFTLGDYDPAEPLYIDPLLATYLGGTAADQGVGVATQYIQTDAELYVYLAGATQSAAAGFPAHGGGAQTELAGDSDAFVARFDHDLQLLNLTFLGGAGRDEAYDIEIHGPSDAVFVAGLTESEDFPTAPSTARGRGAARDAFVAKLSADLTVLEQARYLGGSGNDVASGVAIDDQEDGAQTPDSLYVAGTTRSLDLPSAASGAQATIGGGGSLNDGFAARLGLDLELLQTTYLGGISTDSAQDVRVDPSSHSIYVSGQTAYNHQVGSSTGDFPWTDGGAQAFSGGTDAFVVHLSTDLRQALQATYLGGPGLDFGLALSIHPLSGEVYLAGSSAEAWVDFPAGGAQTAIGTGQDAFVARLSSDLTSLLGATYLGGSSFDRASDAAIPAQMTPEVFVVGRSGSTDFPGTEGGAVEVNSGLEEAFVARLSSDLSELRQSTYVGGTSYDGCDGQGLALGNDPEDGALYVFIGGATSSSDLAGVSTGVAQTANAGSGDAFVARIGASLLLGPPPVDTDQDGVVDSEDNCPSIANSDQLDTDRDGEGNVCDEDDDQDGVLDVDDNCPLHRNRLQADGDLDGVGNICDNCPQVANTDQQDDNNDGVGDLCADGRDGPAFIVTQDPERVLLGDRVTYRVEAQSTDNSAAITLFVDGAAVRTCHKPLCEHSTKPVATAPTFGTVVVDGAGFYRTDGSGTDELTTRLDNTPVGDADNDGVYNLQDNCAETSNPEQSDIDGDGVGDACDQCCPECAEFVIETQYCCMPSYGSHGACTDELGSEEGAFYWEQAYDLMTYSGCGCFDSDGENAFHKGAVYIENESPQDCREVLGHFFCEPARSGCDPTEDYCIDYNTVREYLCGPDGVTHVDIDCAAANPVCDNGRCDCPDSDGGEEYYRRGTLQTDTDICYVSPTTGDILLREFYCGRDHWGNLMVEEISVNCEFGCQEGRCVCEDSDGGSNAAVKGRMGMEYDTCIDHRTLLEVFPHLDHQGTGSCEARTSEITCAGLCVDGACVPPTCQDRVLNQGEEGIDCGGPCPIPCDLCGITESNLPTRFDWRDWRGHSWVTPIQNQASCGSCWAFSAVAAMESKFLIEQNLGWIPNDFYAPPSPTTWHLPDLSEQTLVSDCGSAWGDCTGGAKEDAFNQIRSTGIVDEDCFPYQSQECMSGNECLCSTRAHCSNPRECPTTCADTLLPEWGTRTWTIDDHDPIGGSNTVAAVKDALLCHGPLATCSSDWGHCVAIVGWDNDSDICRAAYGIAGCWIIKHSHGVFTGFDDNGDRYDDSYWAEDGFVYLPFEGHDYSAGIKYGARYVSGVTSASSWSRP